MTAESDPIPLQVEQADVLIWISNQFETSLARLHDKLDKDALPVQLIKGLASDQLIGTGHDFDGHVWLSPTQVKLISMQIADALSQRDPKNRTTYQNNARKLNARLQEWQRTARQKLASKAPQYISDHTFLAYLEHSLDLNSTGSLRNSHDHGSHIRGLSQLHHKLEHTPANCLLVDHLPASRQAQQIAEQHGLRLKRVDILSGASEFASIIDMYQRIVKILLECS